MLAVAEAGNDVSGHWPLSQGLQVTTLGTSVCISFKDGGNDNISSGSGGSDIARDGV